MSGIEGCACRFLSLATPAKFKPFIQDDRLLGLIRDSYVASGGVYGSPRVFADLREAGESCGKHRVERIMRNHKIKAIRGYKSPKASRLDRCKK